LLPGAVSHPGSIGVSKPLAWHSLPGAGRRLLCNAQAGMTRRRWIADRVEGDRAFLLGPNANHLFRVLRVKIGQEFDVAADGVLRSAKVVFASHDQVEFELGAEVESAALPRITVYLSIFKFDRMEWALEKLTELGVSHIFPIIAQRTEEHLAKAAAKRVER